MDRNPIIRWRLRMALWMEEYKSSIENTHHPSMNLIVINRYDDALLYTDSCYSLPPWSYRFMPLNSPFVLTLPLIKQERCRDTGPELCSCSMIRLSLVDTTWSWQWFPGHPLTQRVPAMPSNRAQKSILKEAWFGSSLSLVLLVGY